MTNRPDPQPADPGCFMLPAPTDLDPIPDTTWTAAPDSLKHYGDEFARSDGRTVIITADGDIFIVGWYAKLRGPNGLDDYLDDGTDAYCESTIWYCDSLADVVDLLASFGIDSPDLPNTEPYEDVWRVV